MQKKIFSLSRPLEVCVLHWHCGHSYLAVLSCGGAAEGVLHEALPDIRRHLLRCLVTAVLAEDGVQPW